MDTPEEIRSTIIRLFNATDRRDWETVKSSFASHVLLDYSSMSGNPATSVSPSDVVTSWKKILPGFRHTQHQVSNFEIKFNGSKAHAYCYGTAYHHLPHPKGDNWVVVGSYDFVLASNGHAWKIEGMKFNLKFQSGNEDLPVYAMENALGH